MKKILFICGSLNQTTQMHAIARHMAEYDCYFTPFFGDGILKVAQAAGLLDFTIMGGRFLQATLEYIRVHKLKLDYRGERHDYDLIFTCTDLVTQKILQGRKVVLVQEGMTDPENLLYYTAKYLRTPRYLASTSTTGLSDCYELFCVASEGYRDLFIRKGIKPAKIRITGIPNFDNCEGYRNSSFPLSDFVLVATSDSRETFKYHNRKKFIKRAVEIAGGRQIIFRLHPNEKPERAKREIEKYAPGALVYTEGNTHEMIAHCSALITEYSSVVFTGLALGKEVYSKFNIDDLKKLLPRQNGGCSAEQIALQGRYLLETETINRAAQTAETSVKNEIGVSHA